MQHIGIFGGSFNPIHLGHIALAEEVLRHTTLDEIWLMVSPQNPLKQQTHLLGDSLRLALARKALQGVEGIRASDFEFGLPRPSYTWATLEALRAAYPDCRFSLIIGADNWEHFDRWYRADDIKATYPLIVYPRRRPQQQQPAGDLPERPADDGQQQDVALLEDMKLFDVSSTEVRRRARMGEPLEGLVPDCIVDDVKELYG